MLSPDRKIVHFGPDLHQCPEIASSEEGNRHHLCFFQGKVFWRLAGGFTASASTEAFKKLSFISFSLVWQRSKAPPVELMLFRLIFDFLLHDKTLNAFLRIMTLPPLNQIFLFQKTKQKTKNNFSDTYSINYTNLYYS